MTTNDNAGLRFLWLGHDQDCPILFTHPSGPGYRIWNQMVGGSIEGVYPPSDDGLAMYCHDEARMYGAPENRMATHLVRENYGYSQVGDFIVVSSTEEGDDDGLTNAQLDHVMTELNMVHHGPVKLIVMDTWQDVVMDFTVRRTEQAVEHGFGA